MQFIHPPWVPLCSAGKTWQWRSLLPPQGGNVVGRVGHSVHASVVGKYLASSGGSQQLLNLAISGNIFLKTTYVMDGNRGSLGEGIRALQFCLTSLEKFWNIIVIDEIENKKYNFKSEK